MYIDRNYTYLIITITDDLIGCVIEHLHHTYIHLFT